MNIVYDYQIFGVQKFGGVSRYFYELANNISLEKNTNVSICSPLYINQYLKQSNKNLKIQGYQIPKIKYAGKITNIINRNISKFLFSRIKPDIIHETFYSKKKYHTPKTKIVLSVFDMIDEYFHNNESNKKIFENKSISIARADHIICISNQTKKDLMKFYAVEEKNISVIHLGFSLTNTSSSYANIINRPYLLYVGKREGYKNFNAFLKAYSSMHHIQEDYDLVAFGGGRFSEEEELLIKNLNLNIKKIHQIDGDDSVLANLYKYASLFIYPSFYEGFGIPPLEAMSFDCPVVCSNTSSIPEVVGNAAKLFDPDSIEEIANAIESVLKDSELRENMIVRGRERIKLFSWESCALKTYEIYKELL